MNKRIRTTTGQVKAKALENKATLQLIWRAYQGLFLVVLLALLMGK